MLNPDFSIFNDNMFVQVRQILNDVDVQTNEELLDVTVGEPRMSPPDWLASQLMAASKNWQAYPKAFADQAFLDDLAIYFQTRFPNIAGQFDMSGHIVPVPARVSRFIFSAIACGAQNRTVSPWSQIRSTMPGGPAR